MRYWNMNIKCTKILYYGVQTDNELSIDGPPNTS